MSVQSQTLAKQTRRIPIAAIVAAVLAFSVGIALGANLAGDETAATDGHTTIVVPASNPNDAGAARLQTRQQTIGSRPVPVAVPGIGQTPELRTESREGGGFDLEAALLRNQARRA